MSSIELNRILDDAKFEMFLHPGEGAFLGTLLCNMEVGWDNSIPTACTNGLEVKINSTWFSKLPAKTRATVLMHELRHVGYLHPLRMQGMNHAKFNKAADYAINIQLRDEGYSFEGTEPHLDAQFRGMSAEEIYDLLPDVPPSGSQAGCWTDDPDDADLESVPADEDEEQIVQIVHSAVMAQQQTGSTTDNVDAIYEMIRKRNQPKVVWQTALQDFAQDRARAGLDYTKRNCRYRNVILPARASRGRLMEMDFVFDVSGSVSQGMIEQMIAEIDYIQRVLNPKALNLVQFDTQIRSVKQFRSGMTIDEIEVVGRGGTDLRCVHEYLSKKHTGGAVIMSDLWCAPMKPLDIPLLWLCINNPSAEVVRGQLIHIEVED